MAYFAPFDIAFSAYLLPSKFGPFMLKNIEFSLTFLESIETFGCFW